MAMAKRLPSSRFNKSDLFSSTSSISEVIKSKKILRKKRRAFLAIKRSDREQEK